MYSKLTLNFILMFTIVTVDPFSILLIFGSARSTLDKIWLSFSTTYSQGLLEIRPILVYWRCRLWEVVVTVVRSSIVVIERSACIKNFLFVQRWTSRSRRLWDCTFFSLFSFIFSPIIFFIKYGSINNYSLLQSEEIKTLTLLVPLYWLMRATRFFPNQLQWPHRTQNVPHKSFHHFHTAFAGFDGFHTADEH